MQDIDEQLRRAAFAVRDMREKLQAEQAKAHEPIAVIGMGCRFPGAPDISAFWQELLDGTDAIREIPASRWDADELFDPDPDAPGKTTSRWGGLIDDVELFDAEFFGISPREAVSIDPQQRLLLETAWRAIENAAVPVDKLSAGQTGVYVGISTNDYANLLSRQGDRSRIDAHASLGNSVAVAAGRLSYTLGLTGPSMVVDTACSSSLVAVHLAIRALRSREIDTALAAGVNLTLSPELTIGFSKARMMAADGKCKTFDAEADGYVRGEGCGTVILKRLADALRDRDRVRAVLLGSAVNQDGRSNGLTAPNGPSQVSVIRSAAADAAIDPSEISLFEAHGTGTSLGDPIEAQALSDVVGNRPDEQDRPFLASVKTNIGHLEAAAGMAGLIKTALSLEYGKIPPHLHFNKLNPLIDENNFPLRIPLHVEAMPDVQGRQIAGVSSFGFSGTNAHVIMEAPPAVDDVSAPSGFSVVAISARDAKSVETIARQTCEQLSAPAADFPAIAASLSCGRSALPYRISIAADSAVSASDLLGKAECQRALENPQIGFLFTGQGSQYAGMAKGLMTEPHFRDIVDLADTVLDGMVGRLLSSDELPDGRTDLVQPLLLSLEYALASLWRARGVEPAVVIGHSVGEIAAAAFAGALDFEDALRFVAERGRLMESTAGLGSMAAALGATEKVQQVIDGTGAVIAAHNAPENTVISGLHKDLAQAVERLEKKGIPVIPLQVATAFHSPVLDPVLDKIEKAASEMAVGTAHIPIIANLDGQEKIVFDAAYWRAQAASPVCFRQGLQTLSQRGCSLFLEVGPQPVLSGFGRSMFPEAAFVASLRRGVESDRVIAEAAASLFAVGAPVDLTAAVATRKVVDVPVHPFRQQRYWPDSGATGTPSPVQHTASTALAGTQIDTPCDPKIYAQTVSSQTFPFLADHVVFDEIVVPGAMFAMMGVALGDGPSGCVEDLVFEMPMTVPDRGLNVQLLQWENGRLEIHGRGIEAEQWARHLSGKRIDPVTGRPGSLGLVKLENRMLEDTAGLDAFFDQLSERGIDLGPSFRGTRRLWRGQGEAMAEIEQPRASADQNLDVPLHPASLDACFQTLGATFQESGDNKGYLPLSLDRFQIWDLAPKRFRCHAKVESEPGSPVAIGSFTLSNLEGEVFAQVDGLQIKQIEAPDPVAEMMVGVDWIPIDRPETGWSDPASVAVFVKNAAAKLEPLPENGLSAALDGLAASHARAALGELVDENSVKPNQLALHRRLQAMASTSDDISAPELVSRFPDNAAEIDLVNRCGLALPGVLTGIMDPLEILFPQGGDETSGLYSRDGLADRANQMIADGLAEVLRRRGGGRISILEVGAGTGATTRSVLAQIPDDVALDYVFSDISESFLAQARQDFADRRGIRFELLDLERDPLTQGFNAHGFDVVIAANVVHATRSVSDALTHINQLLVADGVLLMIESTLRQNWWDIVFGLTEGWWRFEDVHLRPEHALLEQSQWQEVLGENGFACPVSVAVDQQARQSIVVARAVRSASVLVVHNGKNDKSKTLALAIVDAAGGEAGSGPLTSAKAVTVRQALSSIRKGGHFEIIYVGGVAASCEAALKNAFDLSKALTEADNGTLSFATWGVQSPVHKEMEIAGAALSGFAKVLALEHRDLGARVVDLDPTSKTPAVDLVAALATPVIGNQEIVVRGAQASSARLAKKPADPGEPPSLDPAGCYLITGAFGGLGLHLAEWLGKNGAGSLILTGRKLPSPEVAGRFEKMAPKIALHEVDITDEPAIGEIVAAAKHTLKGVFHLAGSVADGAIVSQEWSRFASILPAKADGARLLDKLTRNISLDHFVMYSTSAALIGNPGQANHAAANSVLDALARYRNMQGLAGLSINWGAFAEAGAVAEGDRLEAMAAQGVRLIPIDQGLDALGRAMLNEEPNIGVISVDWSTFLSGTAGNVPDFLERFRPRKNLSGQQSAGQIETISFAAELAGVADDELQVELAKLIAIEAAAVLGITDLNHLDHEQPLNEIGLDSLLALELRARLGVASGSKQSATLLFDQPSIAELAEFFVDQFRSETEQAPISTKADREQEMERVSREEIDAMSDAEIEALVDAEYASTTEH